jgi:large subunit ribosomal protein L21
MNAPDKLAASRHQTETPAVYAVVRHGGHQYRVSPGDRLLVDRLDSEVGTVVGLAPVLLLSDPEGVEVDAASLDGIRVAATVAAHLRGPKIRVFTFKPKKRHRRTLGFRAELTELVVDRFVASGEPLPDQLAAGKPPVAGAPAVEAAGEEAATPSAPAESPTRRRRRTAGPAGPSVAEGVAGEAEARVEPAAPAPERATSVAIEAAAARPARRARKPAPALEPAAEEPAQEDASSAPTTARKRRAARTTAPPEAGG